MAGDQQGVHVIYSRIVTKLTLDIEIEGMDSIRIAQNGVHWWAVVYIVMNFRIP